MKSSEKHRRDGDPPRIAREAIRLSRGQPLDVGASLKRGGINFSIFSSRADSVTLVIYRPGSREPSLEIALDPRYNRTGHIWHVFVEGLDPGIEYGYRMQSDQPQEGIDRFDPMRVLLDPASRAITRTSELDRSPQLLSAGRRVRLRRSRVREQDFDWKQDQPLNTHLADSVIYELHVRGFTRDESSGVERPGTYLGLTEKIPYLQELGVTAVELMPVTEFEEWDNPNKNPVSGHRLKNFWGYDPICFNAPHASYANGGDRGDPIGEFKEMVRALHAAGIEVILDMVFNHTGEGDSLGPTYNFRGIDNPTYYIIDSESGRYHNYSGCGNTVNCNHPVVRNMILRSLRYWVTEMHVDGFRFDLASILGRGQDGSVLVDPPLLERIAADPILANTKLIAEAWDAAGLYQVGSFPNWRRWAEWNGKYRDDLRRFVKSDPGMVQSLALRLMGSPDLYHGDGRAPYHSVNFITCHDGFTLHDLVSYNVKHNEENGEDNTDGSNTNFSWNCGVEGPTSSGEVNRLRDRQVRNLATLLFLSQGVPMILAGDEMGRSQNGNNNAYCQDNKISWLNWDLLKERSDLFRFFQILIRFRRENPLFRARRFSEDDPSTRTQWHGLALGRPDMSHDSRVIAMHSAKNGTDVYLIANAYWEARRFQIPALEGDRRWRRFIDTSLHSPGEITEIGDEVPLSDRGNYRAGPRSVVVLVSK